jgi:protein associated with RNAse G/E
MPESTASSNPDGPSIIVRACKFDGREHRRWRARLSRREASLLVLDASFDEEVNHPLLGHIARGTLSLEYYWLDRWYNVFRFSAPDGTLRNYYCNVNVPPTFDGRVLEFIDLDMDVVVAPDLTYKVLDEDEFAANARLFNYPLEVKRHAHSALDELIRLIETRQFPFDC